VAGHLAAGSTLAALGTPTDTIQALPWPAPRAAGEGVVEATVVHVDRFGNLVTSYDGDPRLIRRVSVAGRDAAPSTNYLSDAPLIALVGSSGLLEVSVPGGDAARALGVSPGAPVRITLAQSAG
jgi:S-adenosylmethionine hydrolase